MAHTWWHRGLLNQTNTANSNMNTLREQAETYMGTGLQNRMPGFRPLYNRTPNVTNVNNNEGRQQYIPVSPTLQNTTQRESTGFFKKDPDKTLDIFGGNVTSGISNITDNPNFEIGMNTNPEYQAQLKLAKEKEIQESSATLNQTMASKPEIPAGIKAKDADKENLAQEKTKWYENIGKITQNFLNNLDDPTFQTALNMHIASKDGGDITDVLQAGIKTKAKVTEALLQAQKNQLDVQKTQLDMQVTSAKLTTPAKASKEVTNIISQTLQGGQYNLKENVANAAAGTIAETVEQLRVNNPNVPVNQLINAAIQSEIDSGRLQKDPGGMFGMFNRGSYDITRSTGNTRSLSELKSRPSNAGKSDAEIRAAVEAVGLILVD